MATDDDIELNTSPPPKGPGRRLRESRLGRGLEIEWVANQLHLKPSLVETLENDDFDHLPSPVFVKGYLRNYARLVSEPEEEILRDYRRYIGDEIDEADNVRVVQGSGEKFHSGHLVVRLFSWGVLLATLGLFAVGGFNRINWNNFDLGGFSLAGLSERMGSLLSRFGGEEKPARSVVLRKPSTSVQRTDAPVAGVADEAEPAQVPDKVERKVETEPSGNEPVEPDEPLEVAKDIVIQLNGTSWVDVKDSTGNFKLSGKMKKGDRHVFGGMPPYKIMLGNSGAVTLLVGGRPYDLKRHRRGTVTRFTLDPPR